MSEENTSSGSVDRSQAPLGRLGGPGMTGDLVPQHHEVAISSGDPMGFILAAIDAIDILVAENEGNTEGLTHAMKLVEQMKKHIGILADSVNGALWHSMKESEEFVDGVGYLRKDFATKRQQWQWDEITSQIYALVPKHQRVDTLSGELEDPAYTALRLLRECVSFSTGKVGGFKALGLNVDNYCTKSVGRQKVNITEHPTPGSKYLKQLNKGDKDD